MALNCSQCASATLISIALKEGIPYRCPRAVLVFPSPTSVWAHILLSVQNPLPSAAFSGQNILWPRFNSNDTQSFPPPRGARMASMGMVAKSKHWVGVHHPYGLLSTFLLHYNSSTNHSTLCILELSPHVSIFLDYCICTLNGPVFSMLLRKLIHACIYSFTCWSHSWV